MCWNWLGKWRKLTPKQQPRPSALKRKYWTHYILCVSKRFHHLRNRCEMSYAVITGPAENVDTSERSSPGKIQVQKNRFLSNHATCSVRVWRSGERRDELTYLAWEKDVSWVCCYREVHHSQPSTLCTTMKI